MERIEWLKWRRKGIGGSDMPAIMGNSPYKTVLDIFEDKIAEGEPVEQSNYVAERGNRMEPKIRALYNLLNDTQFVPKLLESGEFDFARCSLDGWDEQDAMEIKTVGKDAHAEAKLGIVPEKYKDQVQWNLFVSGARRLVYVSYYDPEWKEDDIRSEHMAVVFVLPDKERIGKLIEVAARFWTENVLKKKPPVAIDRDYKPLRGVAQAAQAFKRLKLKLDRTAEELEKVRAELLQAAEAANAPRCSVAGIRLSKIAKVGNVDYASIPQLAGVDLEKFRKKGSTYWKVEV